jgi:hypothetical protein
MCRLSPINAAEDLMMIRRREFIAGLAGAAVWPVAARAQLPARMRRVGCLYAFAKNDPIVQARVSGRACAARMDGTQRSN